MTLWAKLTIMSGIAAVFVAIPILRRRDLRLGSDPSGFELFREQIRELDREVANGTISSEDASVTRAEIERRTLAAARGQRQVSMTGLSGQGTSILHRNCGRLGRSWQCAALQQHRTARSLDQLGDCLRCRKGLRRNWNTDNVQPLGEVNEMITRLADRLAREPGDLAGWQMLGWSYFKVGRYAEAADAYARAVSLAPKNGEFLSLQAEALVNLNGGSVSEAALALVEKSLNLIHPIHGPHTSQRCFIG